MYDEKRTDSLLSLLFDDEEDSNDLLDSPVDDTELLIEDLPSIFKPVGNQRVGLGKIPKPPETQKVQRGGILTDVDLVFVIDCTGSMEPFLNMVKTHAKTLHNDIIFGLDSKSRRVNKMRIKVIAFRDYYFDWADPEHPPMLESDFFTLPNQQEEYAAFVDKLEFAGGEDEPESALEALHLAFHSKWMADPSVTKRRQIILLFTDASAHPLNDSMRFDSDYNAYYPEGVPDSLDDLLNEYMSPDVFPPDSSGYPTGHRLILFAPENMQPWNQVKNWPETTCKSMDPEKGLEGISMEEVITFIGGSLG